MEIKNKNDPAPKIRSQMSSEMSSEMTHRDMMVGSYVYDGSVTDI